MPVRNHLGQQVAVRTSSGQRCKVYLMTPTGLVPIDVVLAFNPQPGNYSVSDTYSAFFTVSCTQAAVWTYTKGSTVSASVSSGASATSITFQVDAGGTIGKPIPRSGSVQLTASVGGSQYSFTITLTAGTQN